MGEACRSAASIRNRRNCSSRAARARNWFRPVRRTCSAARAGESSWPPTGARSSISTFGGHRRGARLTGMHAFDGDLVRLEQAHRDRRARDFDGRDNEHHRPPGIVVRRSRRWARQDLADHLRKTGFPDRRQQRDRRRRHAPQPQRLEAVSSMPTRRLAPIRRRTRGLALQQAISTLVSMTQPAAHLSSDSAPASRQPLNTEPTHILNQVNDTMMQWGGWHNAQELVHLSSY